MRSLRLVSLGIFFAWIQPSMAGLFVLTDDERAWIVKHPIVRMAVDPDWKPIEYVEDGRYMGMASEYVEHIERLTGLKFVVSNDTGLDTVTQMLKRKEVDVLPATLRESITPSVARLVTFTQNYYVGTTIVITRDQGTVIYDLNQLDGKSVSLKGGGAYQDKVQMLYPGINVVPGQTPDQELMAVAEGRADAVVGAGAALLPYLKRKYHGELRVAGAIGCLPMELSMAVRNDLPLLQSIINKALASLSAKQTNQMVERWFEGTDYGEPSLSVLLRYYAPQLALIGFSLLLISGFALHARRERRRAVQSEKEKTMFLAVLSHEIRSPMNATLASMELLQRHPLPKEPRLLLDVASNGAEHLLRLLDDVLDISKLEAGRLQLDITPMDVMEVSRTVIDLQAFKAQEKGIFLELKEDGSLTHRLMLDRLRVEQVLHNLISNAVKFTLSGGVTASLKYEAASSGNDLGRLCICIADTGIGIDTTARQRLFEPYSQASAATARKFGGTGLGLPICRQLVELMKGSIEIESELERGTRITVNLPCEMHTVQSPARGKASVVLNQDLRLRGASQLNVLLVEDTLANQAVFQAQLDVLGCRHVLAVNGLSALRALEKAEYDIVLLDCDLPDITGYQVAQRWREQENERGLTPTPILAISASTDAGHTVACFEARMDGVLIKPIKLGKLRDALQLWCDVSLEQDVDDVLVNTFLDHASIIKGLEADLCALRAAYQADDADQAAHYAHRLVGACEVVGALETAALAKVLEGRFKQRPASTTEVSLMELALVETSLSKWATASAIDNDVRH